MVTKRGFIAGAASAAAAVATVAWRPQTRGRDAGTTTAPLDAVVFNERYSDARAFAQVFAKQGILTLPVAGDAGTLWYGSLKRRIVPGTTRIAAMGTPMDLFILETLARDAGLRVRLRLFHDARGAATLSHSVSANEPVPELAGALAPAGARWPESLARALPGLACAARGQPRGAALSGLDSVKIGGAGAERSHDHPGMLISWILA